MEQEAQITGPMRPEDALDRKREQIPGVVFETFNGLIAEQLSSIGQAIIYQDVVVEMLKDRGLNSGDIYSKKWLDVEPIYRDAGWDVEYDRPVYYAGEDFRAYFKFTKPDRKQ